jgi:carbamoyltransferase
VKESPFMLHTFFVKEEFKNTFPSITHIDGSSRIQTVRKDQNERYYNLMKEIEKINGHPVVLDTSFNDQGEPIICTPQEALKCFYSTGIDVLAIGNFILEK